MGKKDKAHNDKAKNNNPMEEKYYDFRKRLCDAGVSQEHLSDMFDRIMLERAEAETNAAKLYYSRYTKNDLSSARFCDMLGDMVTRLHSVQVAMDGLQHFVTSEPVYEGARLVVDEAVLEMRRVSTAFAAADTLARRKATQSKKVAA